ncbi:AMP-binding protein [Rhodohalobacter sp.]|uniref:AMP-binding protein n=1 Tax=Rhodohalobacter sp. TaxID=1974210 RepID=UPI002ACE3DA2|nr:AMP-binding protein [Rhodohalobacter sp.]MDZ7755220.1 AMP-binding protein [Rhodohalobacter sp.]
MNRLLQHWLTEQAEKFPDKTAIRMGDQSLSYQELERASNRLARILGENGCRQGDRVGFYMPKSPEAYISIFGILKADCLYVPLDPEGPVLRTIKMINKGGVRFLLTTRKSGR